MHKGFRVNISFHFSWIRTLEWENLGGMVGVHLHFQGAANRLQSGRGLVQPPPGGARGSDCPPPRPRVVRSAISSSRPLMGVSLWFQPPFSCVSFLFLLRRRV